MLISSCPLRVSLFGGSTDNPFFVEKYGQVSVISFTSNLKTYITLHQDQLGYNAESSKYIINYSKREEVQHIQDIKNELVRIVLDHFNCNPMNISMTSDAYSQGSGLASSSSYIISLIKAISMFNDLSMTDVEICKLAYKLELKMNPYCGYQDPYGCGIGGFKKIDFYNGGIVKYDFLSTDLFKYYDMALVFTGVTRNSRGVLKSVTDNLDKAVPLMQTVENAYDALLDENYPEFLELLNLSWDQKKKTTSHITENKVIRTMDKAREESDSVIAHKLCGAGNGGFFLVFSKKNDLNIPYDSVKINVSPNGVKGKCL